MNISSNYDYNSQVNSTQMLQRLLQKKNTQNASSVQELFQSSDNTVQPASEKKSASPLNSLVAAGTITSDQEQAIKEALETAKMAYQTQAGAANASSTFKNPLDSLVTAGTITEDQKAAVKSTLDSARNSQRMMSPPPPPPSEDDSTDALTSALDSLVEAGTITEDQQKYIQSALESAIQAYSAQSYSFDDMLLNSYETGI